MSTYEAPISAAHEDAPTVATKGANPRPSLSIVAPVFNEEDTLVEFHMRTSKVLDEIGASAEILYVNDGSRDRSLAILAELQGADPRVAVINLSRNFGKEIALTAGLDHSRGEAVVIIDSDLQHPPELIPAMISRWREGGVEVVYATRTQRHGETALKKFTARYFYRLLHRLSEVQIPQDATDYRLLSRRAVDVLTQLREQHRFMKGLFAWIGFGQTSVSYDQEPRFAGQTKWSYWKLWNLAIEGITSFTTIPLRIASYLGVVTSLVAFLFAIWIVFKTLVWGEPVAGYPTLMVVILFLGGVQLAALGVIGEYLGRTFNETKRRPLYIVDSYRPAPALSFDAAQDGDGYPEVRSPGLRVESPQGR
jgi:glycosyltransferase involved in cell wall biosynthesis